MGVKPNETGSEAILGLASGTVRVVPYDPRWPALFIRCAADVEGALGTEALAIHHVGSTAVPGLAAKPILDILVGVQDFDRARALVPRIEGLGYEFRPDQDVVDRHYFRRPAGPGRVRTHHLSLAEPGSDHFRATIAFRDALRGVEGLAEEYATLKLRLAKRYPRDREAYLEGKTAFVRRVLEVAGYVR